MKVRLLFFAALREQLGTAAEEIELPAEVTSVAGLRAHLMQRGEPWQAVLGDKRLVRVAVNQEYAGLDHPVKPGDEVALFPPVTGG